jgi:PIN domain nuclease of toxin-antitoxin system
MATKVLDSWALMALFNEEPAADAVEKLLAQAATEKHKLLMSVVNWGEIYYSVMRGASPEMAEQKAREIAAIPVEIVDADLATNPPGGHLQGHQKNVLRRLFWRGARQNQECRIRDRRPGA